MIRFRDRARSWGLTVVGSVRRPSKSVHILAGHHMGKDLIKDRSVFGKLLDDLAVDCELITIQRAVALVRSGTRVTRPMLAFTFDDGFMECYTHIAPELESRGVNAAFFINPNFARGGRDYIEQFTRTAVMTPGKEPMRASEIRDLAERGFVIGAHTLDHVRLNNIDSACLSTQVVGCRDEVERISGVPCEYFAWTYGRYLDISADALSLVRQTYGTVFSSDRYREYGLEDLSVLNRRHFEPDWPASHLKYFLAPRRIYI